MNKNRLLAAAAIFAAPISAAHAQQITSQIEGSVFDEAGAPLDNATVTVTDTRTGATRTIQTSSGGSFTATNLVTGGPYTVTVEAAGFQGQTITDINTSVQAATALSFSLSAAEAGGSETIVVTGQRVNIQLRAIGPGTAFGTNVLENAPTFRRDVRDIIRIDPRVSLDRDDGGSGQDRISCLGGNDRGNSFTVDGIQQGDVYGLNDTGFSSRSSTPIPYDAVRETQVQFAPFDVEFGQFTGCAINVITKSGSNDFRATAFYEYSNSDLRGDNVAGRPVAPIEPERNYGATISGPIVPDRLFFFLAYEHQESGQAQDDGPAGAGFANELQGVPVAEFNRISEILSRVYGIETGELVRSRPFSNDRYFGRLDWQINDDHRLELTYQRLEEGAVRPDDFSTTASNPRVTGINTFLTSGTVSNYYSGRIYSQWNDVISTEFRYSRSEVNDLQDPVGGGEAQSANPIPRIIVGIDNATGPDGQVLAGPGFSRSANDLQTRIDQYRAVMNIDAGDHQLKFGFEANHADLFNLFVQNATGTLYFRNAAALEAGLLSTGTNTNPTAAQIVAGQAVGAVGNFTATGNVRDAAAAFTRTIYSAYVQDDWRVNDRLKMTGGVRIDWLDGGSPALNPNFQARYGFGNNTGFGALDPVILPRLGFTYDFSDFAVFSRAQLRGGVGIFSGGDPLVWFGNAFQNDGRGFAEGSTTAAACGGAGAQIDVVQNGQFTGVPTCFAAVGRDAAARGLGDTQSIDPDIKMPTVIRANIGFQAGLDFSSGGFFSGWNLNLDYIYSRYQDAYTLVDLSQVPDPSRGLNGRTVDGRPIYQAIEPTRPGCTAVLVDVTPTPTYTGVNAACFGTSRDDELMLTNGGPFESHIASAILSKNFERGLFTDGGSVFVSLGYSYTDSQDRRNMYNSTAGSNFDLSAAFDRQNPDASRGFYSSKHNISFSTSFEEQFFGDLSTRFGFSFIARSGRPYSLTFSGGGVFADSTSGNDNALLYIPTGVNDPNLSPSSDPAAVAGLVGFLGGLNCAQGYAGRTIARNTCSNDWYYDLDLSFSQEIPGPGRLFGRNDSLRLYATVDNFLNLLNSGWNVQRRRNFAGLQDLAQGGVDAQGRYIITNFVGQAGYDADNTINTSSSVWQLKVGISYRF